MNLPVAIIGASGFSGATLVALLAHHPHVDLQFLGSQNYVGRELSDLYPSLHHLSKTLPTTTLQSNEDLFAQARQFHTVFCALPHTETPTIVSTLTKANPDLYIVDLSAAFRLQDESVYQQTYQQPLASELASKAIYGLCEVYREKIRTHRIIANPGCYTTTCLLPLVPLLEQNIIKPNDIIIDSKSGVSGAGRTADVAFSYPAIAENFQAYGLEGHRHEPEILQELRQALLRATLPSEVLPSFLFSPHLVPMKRGILTSIYVQAREDSQTIWHTLNERYHNEPFVTVLPFGAVPSTHHANYTNQCVIGVVKKMAEKRCTLISATDNLIKGASGQAIQNFNIFAGCTETLGLTPTAISV